MDGRKGLGHDTLSHLLLFFHRREFLYSSKPLSVHTHCHTLRTIPRHAFSTWHISSVIVDELLSNAVPVPSSVALPTHNFEKQSRQWVNNLGIDLPLVAALACLSWSLELSMSDYVTYTSTILWDHYSAVLVDHPLATKAASFAAVYTLGDIIAQMSHAGLRDDLDRDRIARSMLIGLMVHCPMSYLWCNVCDAIFVDVLHLTTGWVYLPRVVIDQNVWGPLWNKTYLLLIGLMKRKRVDFVWDDVQKSPIPVVLSSHKSMAHLVTYLLIPAEYQRFWMDLVELLWVALLSTRAAGLDASANSAVETTGVAQPPPVPFN
jgi:protein Mpv17